MPLYITKEIPIYCRRNLTQDINIHEQAQMGAHTHKQKKHSHTHTHTDKEKRDTGSERRCSRENNYITKSLCQISCVRFRQISQKKAADGRKPERED